MFKYNNGYCQKEKIIRKEKFDIEQKYNSDLAKKIEEMSKEYDTILSINNKSIDLVEKLSDLENFENKYNINIQLDALKNIKDKMLIK